MDAFDFKEDPVEEKRQRKPGDVLFTLGTYYFLASSLCLIVYFVIVYLDPYTPINPFMPPTAAPVEELSSSLSGDQATPQATWTISPASTETPAPLPSATRQSTPTETLIPYPTPTDVILATSQPISTTEGLAHFVAQEGTPDYIPYSGGCTGVYVAGNVIDIDDRPVVLMIVRAIGTIGGQTINFEVLTGSNTDYSESGWEIKLSDQLISTPGTISVGLYAQGVLDPISDLVVINTYNDCSRNLAVVNFVQDQ